MKWEQRGSRTEEGSNKKGGNANRVVFEEENKVTGGCDAVGDATASEGESLLEHVSIEKRKVHATVGSLCFRR